MNIEAITFDFWNTLAVDSAPVEVREMAAERMTRLLKEAGFMVDCENMMKAFDQCRQHCYFCQEVKGIDFTPREQLDWIMDYFEIKPEPDLWNGLFDAYTTTILEVPPVFVEGLEGILKELAARFKLALICNTGRTPGWVVRKVLSRQGFERYFNTLIFSNEVGVAKPNPYIFEIAARVLEVQPDKTLHVGDSLITDVAGASGAGFRAGWYNPTRIDKKVECDVVLWDFSDILKIQ